MSKVSVSVVAVLVLSLAALNMTLKAEGDIDRTLSQPAIMYVPTAADLAYVGTNAGDIAEGDVAVGGSALQYTGVSLNGDGVNATAQFPFLKVQADAGSANFTFAACYLGNNGASFGLGFFALTQPFSNAHMKASRSGSTVTINFTNVNGGSLANQTYVCNGAPAPVGDKIGVQSYSDNAATIDNFSNGTTVLDAFNYTGTLGSTGNWADVSPGMHANGSKAIGGLLALSFYKGPQGAKPVLSSIVPISGKQGSTMYMRLSGSNFVPGSTSIAFGGGGISVVKIDIDKPGTATQMVAKLAIASNATLGTRPITVSTPTGGQSNALNFVVTAANPAACPASLPLTVTGGDGNLNITAGLSNSQAVTGTWVTGWLVFSPTRVSFQGVTNASGTLAPSNPAVSRTMSVAARGAQIAVVNALYNPYLCGFTMATPNWPVSREAVSAALDSIGVEDYNGSVVDNPR
jgi:hypothetical protein